MMVIRLLISVGSLFIHITYNSGLAADGW